MSGAVGVQASCAVLAVSIVTACAREAAGAISCAKWAILWRWPERDHQGFPELVW
jgi:hypothetical protein